MVTILMVEGVKVISHFYRNIWGESKRKYITSKEITKGNQKYYVALLT